jgi:hypothetical protein
MLYFMLHHCVTGASTETEPLIDPSIFHLVCSLQEG